MTAPFKVFAELTTWQKAGEDHPMRVGGIASTAALDADEERLVQEGLSFDTFLTEGWFNDNHGKRSSDVLGYGTGAKLVSKGDRLPNGKLADKRGWWVEGYLLDTPEGRKVWNLTQALQDTPRKLGMSIEGDVLERDPMDNKVVRRADVRNVAITHCPKNTDTNLHALAKSLAAGAPSSATFASRAGGTPGDGAPLATHGPAADDPVVDPEEIAKAVDQDMPVSYDSDVSLVEDWADALAEARDVRPAQMTKAEARCYLALQRPDLDSNTIDRILATAETTT